MIIDGLGLVSNPDGNHPMGAVAAIALHHEGPPATRQSVLSPALERQVIENIDLYHKAAPRNYGGFAYHGAVFASGRAYKTGAYTGTRAHIHRQNSKMLGIVYLDDLSHHGATKEGLDGIAALILDMYLELGIEVPVGIHTELALPGSGSSCPMQLAGQVTEIMSIVRGDDVPTQEQFDALREQVQLHSLAGLVHAEWDRISAKWKSGAKLTAAEVAWMNDVTTR